MRKLCSKLLLFLALFSGLEASAESSVEFGGISILLSDTTRLPSFFKTSLSCHHKGRLSELEMGTQLIERLRLAGIDVKKSSKYRLSVVVEQNSCGVAGKDSYHFYPLGIGHNEEDISYAHLRVTSELVDKGSSEILHISEYSAAATLSKTSARILFLVTEAVEKKVKMTDLWKSVEDQIVSDLKGKL